MRKVFGPSPAGLLAYVWPWLVVLVVLLIVRSIGPWSHAGSTIAAWAIVGLLLILLYGLTFGGGWVACTDDRLTVFSVSGRREARWSDITDITAFARYSFHPLVSHWGTMYFARSGFSIGHSSERVELTTGNWSQTMIEELTCLLGERTRERGIRMTREGLRGA